ncbi:MAG: sigma 54-interacting transcriptional regulator [Bdellovibrionales bacterium]|nr:sigma 54-interacting transcriptional regulator [Bdellovibrionales bacterium]
MSQPLAARVPISRLLTMGRDSACDIQVEDPFVSRRHCRIEKVEQGFRLKDLRSRNGTLLNGIRIHEAPLCDGDRLQIGNYNFRFSSRQTEDEDSKIFLSKNHAWQSQLSRLPSVASSDLPVLILGSSGTGKELLARRVHDLSSRREGPYVSVNCSALGESLVESELFGHIKGSFTGATGDRKGAFESARGGTLFLDEVGDLPMSLQPKLLRALENEEIRPVGSDKNIRTDVRIIAATHANLRKNIQNNLFREDLFYRLHGLQISPPDLQNRMEDFETLLYGFAKHQRVRFSFAAIEHLKTHPWPGNIRELKNLVSRAKALVNSDQVEVADLKLLLDPVATAPEPALETFRETSLLKQIEKQLIVERLEAHKGVQKRVADELGLAKSTLHDRIREYHINPKSFKGLKPC